MNLLIQEHHVQSPALVLHITPAPYTGGKPSHRSFPQKRTRNQKRERQKTNYSRHEKEAEAGRDIERRERRVERRGEERRETRGEKGERTIKNGEERRG